MNLGYEFLNARAKALKARMIPEHRLRDLARVGKAEVLQEILAATTAYGRELGETASLERALMAHLARVFGSFWKEAREEICRWLGLWLGPWELQDLKNILRGWQSHRTPEEIASTWAAVGPLSREEWNELAETESVSALSEKLRAKGALYAVLADALRGAPEGPLSQTEDRLDEAWARWATSESRKNGAEGVIFARFFSGEIDARNLVSALRGAHAGGERPGFFLPGGARLGVELFRELAGQRSLEEAFALLRQHEPFAAVAEPPPYQPERALSRAERRLRALTLERWRKLYQTSDPLGLAVLLWFLTIKGNEVVNLRRIAWGLIHRLPSGLIEEELVFA